MLLLVPAAGSLFILYSASGKNWDLVIKQATSRLGLGAMLVIAQFEPRFMARWVPLGSRRRGVAGRGRGGRTHGDGGDALINIPGVIRFQPSEFMKIIMPMTIAWYLSSRSLPPSIKHTAISLSLILVPADPEAARSGYRVVDPGFRRFCAIHRRVALALDHRCGDGGGADRCGNVVLRAARLL